MSRLERDVTPVITQQGIQRELEAIEKGEKFQIAYMVIDSVLLPDDRDPSEVVYVSNAAHQTFRVHAKVVNNTLIMISDIPTDVGGFEINGVAFCLADGTVYAYARGYGDVKTTLDPLRIKFEMKHFNAGVIEDNYDDSLLFVSHLELNQKVLEHVAESDPHTQYLQKAHAAVESDIDGKKSGLVKYINLSMLWRAFDVVLKGRRINTAGPLKGGRDLSGNVNLDIDRATTTRLGVTQLTDDDGVSSDVAASQKLVMRLKVALTNLINTKHTEAKSYTDTKHGEAINHTNVEKGKTIETLKSWVLGLFIKKEDLSHLSKGLFSKLDVTSEFGLSDYGMRNSTYCHMFTEATAGFYAYKDISASNLLSREQVVITSPTPTRDHHATRRDFVLGLDKENVKKDSEENVNLKLVNNSHHAGRSWDRLDETAKYLFSFTPPRNGQSGAGNIDIYINNFGAASFSLFAHNAMGTTYLTGFCSGGIYSNIRLLGCRDANDASKFHVYVKLNTGSIGYTPRAVFDLVGDFEFNEPDSLPPFTNEWSSDVAKFASIDLSGRVKAQRFEMPSSGLLMGNVNMMGSDIDITRFGDATAQRTVLLKAKDCKIEVNDGGPKRYAIFHENNLPTLDQLSITGERVNGVVADTKQWVKAMTVTMPQSASSIVLEITNGSGYNVGASYQCGTQRIYLRSGNASPKGITIQSIADGHLSAIVGNVSWKHIGADEYEVYLEVNNYANRGLIWEVKCSRNASFEWHGEAIGTAKPAGLTDALERITSYSTAKKPTAEEVGALKSAPSWLPSSSNVVNLGEIDNGFVTNYGAHNYWTDKPDWLIYGIVESRRYGNLGYQLIFDSNHPRTTSGKLGYRTHNTQGWGDFIEVYTTQNKPTNVDVGLGNLLNMVASSTYTSNAAAYFTRKGAHDLFNDIIARLNNKVSKTEASVIQAQSTWTDNHAAAFGNGGDFRVFHSGAHSYMDNFTGNVLMRQRKHGGSMYFQCENADGATHNVFAAIGGSNTYFAAYYNHVVKFRATLNGAQVFGRLDADTVYEDGERVYSPNNPPPKTLEPGMLIIWSGSEPPPYAFEYRGQQFDKASNPKLAALYPSGYLPDYRDDFPRFAGNGRAVGSKQGDAMRNLTGSIYTRNRSGGGLFTSADGIFETYGAGATVPDHYNAGGVFRGVKFDASKQVPVAGEFRPRNAAFMALTLKG